MKLSDVIEGEPVLFRNLVFDPKIAQAIIAETIPAVPDQVDHPAHYGGKDDPYEAIKVINAWDLGFELGNALKYIARAGKKDPAKRLEDLKKAAWYLAHEIAKH